MHADGANMGETVDDESHRFSAPPQEVNMSETPSEPPDVTPHGDPLEDKPNPPDEPVSEPDVEGERASGSEPPA